jgi:hypothetical protein
MRTITVVVCLFLTGISSVRSNPNQSKETSKMSQGTEAVRFIQSDTLSPTVGYSHAVVVTHPGKLIYIAG